jgi:uncharacterized repeat protein (TIGR01451 family)
MRTHRTRKVSTAIVSVIGLIALGFNTAPAHSIVLQDMSIAYQGTLNGNFASTGNSVLTCSTTDGSNASFCADAQQRKGSKLNNDDFVMTNLKTTFSDVSSSSFFNSSQGVLSIPANSEIVNATLFWGGSLRLNSGDTAATDSSKKNRVLFALGNESCSGSTSCQVTSARSDVYQVNAQSNLGPYRASADVTSRFTNTNQEWTLSGPHQTMLISVANIQTTLGIDKAAGWGILVAYKDPDSSPRSITIYKGFAQESMIQDDEFDFNNFQTASRGNVLVDFGLVAFDGDATLTADSISLIDSKASVVIADRVNPDNNIANSTISTSGIHNPYLNNSSPSRSRNTFGIDVDQISMVNGLSRNVTSAEAWPSASADVFFISGLALSVEITSPDIELTKSVSSLSGSDPTAVEVGDIVEYKITATNNGRADASNVQVFDELPADLSSVTSTGANCASTPPQTICKKLNSLDAGESATFTISGTINGASQSSAGIFDNQASATYEGPFGTQRAISESVSIKYGALITDLATTVAFSRDYIQAGQNATLTASITNLGSASDPDPVLRLTAQNGAKLSLAAMPAGCATISTTSISCNASALGVSSTDPLISGETVDLKLTVKPARTTSWLTVWATSETSLAGSDANSSNDTSMTKLYVNHKPRAKIAKTTAIAGGDAVTFSLASKISDVDGDSLGVTLGKVKYGSASIAGDVVTFTPPKNWDGKFSIPYTVRDGKGGLAKSLIAVTVKPKPTVVPSINPTSKPVVDPGRYCFKAGC